MFYVSAMIAIMGAALLGEKVSIINAIGIAISILGVALISYRP